VHRYVTECPGGKVGHSRSRFQHALDRLAGRGGAPHPHARRGFMYPRDSKDKSKPGRLRLLVRSESDQSAGGQAGGRATTGTSASWK